MAARSPGCFSWLVPPLSPSFAITSRKPSPVEEQPHAEVTPTVR
jgi:hypothetical protein